MMKRVSRRGVRRLPMNGERALEANGLFDLVMPDIFIDRFTGRAPDLGVLEHGKPSPHHGARL